VTFILHVAVATIAAYSVMTVPEFIKPWLQTFRSRQRQARRRVGSTTIGRVKTQGKPKINKDKMLIALIQQLMQKPAKGGEKSAAVQEEQENIHFDF
jgi:hypothetical protein